MRVDTDRARCSLFRRWNCSWCCLRVNPAWISDFMLTSRACPLLLRRWIAVGAGSSGGYRVDLSASGVYAHITCEIVLSSHFFVASIAVSSKWSVPSSIIVSLDCAGRSLLLRLSIAVGADFECIRVNLPAQQITSCTPSTGSCSSMVMSGWTEGALVP